jgi:hypothetical protein
MTHYAALDLSNDEVAHAPAKLDVHLAIKQQPNARAGWRSPADLDAPTISTLIGVAPATRAPV